MKKFNGRGKYFLMKQEYLYWNSNLKDKKWYRRLYGGEWRLLKFGKDTPHIGMFTTWTKMGDEAWSGYNEVLKNETYPETMVNSKYKLYKQFVKQVIFKRYESK